MKIKIIIAPLLIVFIVAMVIWVIVPGFKTMQASQKKVEVKQKELDQVLEKNSKMSALTEQLKGAAEAKSVALAYVPETKQEELILQSIYSTADSNSLAILSVAYEDEAAKQAEVAEVMDVEGNVQSTAPSAKAKYFHVKLSLSGSYADIISFFDQLARLKMFNAFTSLQIGEIGAQEGASAKGSDNLQVTSDLRFSYLTDAKNITLADIDSGLLNNGQFDFGIISEIKRRTSTEISRIEVGTAGRDNPFKQ